MSDNIQNIEELFQKQLERDQAIIQEAGENLKQIFTDSKQFEVVFDIYQQVYKLSGDVQELNHANIFLNAYIEGFNTFLVGEGKLISEEDFKHASTQAYESALKTITEAANKMTGETESND